jgi:DNA-binding IscR family transcriptional regulator
VRDGILKGIRGPHGGYALALERNRIGADDILRAARTADELPGQSLSYSAV